MLKADLEKNCCDVHFQIILMDINMPVMNGIESATKIGEFQNEFYLNICPPKAQLIPRAPIIAMTAFCNQKTVQQCKQAGMIGVIYKPINKTGMEKFIQCVVEKDVFKIMQDKLRNASCIAEGNSSAEESLSEGSSD